jgi:ABC-type glycerol-3-phosphate transport system substrate-binding protein
MQRFISLLVLCCLIPLMSCSQQSSKKADVVIWHWMTDRQAAFDKLAQKYQQQTGIKVAFETYAPSEVYKDKVRAAASGKLLPEVFSPLGDKRETSSFINSGYIKDLTQSMESGWKNILFPKAVLQNSYTSDNEFGVKPGVYGVPIDVNAIMIYYNKDLFKQVGLDPETPPQTWEEFVAAGKKLRSAGIQPFVSGFGEGWLLGVFASSYEWNLLGKEGIIDTIHGKITYTDPRWVRIFSLFQDMKDSGMFASGIATMVNKDAERTFATGKAAMALNGSWGVNVYYGMNPNLNYGVMMPPKLKDAKFPMLIFGGEGSSLNINPNSPNADKAIAFLKWLTEKDQQVFLSQETRNIPVNKDCVQGLAPVLATFAANASNTFEPLPLIEDWQVTSAINTGLQAIIIGEKKPDQVAKDVQAEKERQQKAKVTK